MTDDLRGVWIDFLLAVVDGKGVAFLRDCDSDQLAEIEFNAHEAKRFRLAHGYKIGSLERAAVEAIEQFKAQN